MSEDVPRLAREMFLDPGVESAVLASGMGAEAGRELDHHVSPQLMEIQRQPERKERLADGGVFGAQASGFIGMAPLEPRKQIGFFELQVRQELLLEGVPGP